MESPSAELVARMTTAGIQATTPLLSCGREHLAERDAAGAKANRACTGSIFLPDFNRSQFGAVVSIMEILGIPVLIQDHGRAQEY